MIPSNVRDHRDDSACARDRDFWRKGKGRGRFDYSKSDHGRNDPSPDDIKEQRDHRDDSACGRVQDGGLEEGKG